MFISAYGAEPEFGEVRRKVNEGNVVEQAKELIEEIRERFREKVGHMNWRAEL